MKATAHPVVAAALLPHAPILAPPVGGPRGNQAAATIHAMMDAARRVVALAPDALVVLSPHTPRRRGGFALWSERRVRGTFAPFGAPRAVVDFPRDEPLTDALRETAGRAGLHLWRLAGAELDHGATVPLWHLADAGWRGPTVVVGLDYPGEPGLEELGASLAAAGRAAGRGRLAIIASGDMSHRLQPGAPAGFDPRARDFDAAFLQCVRAGQYRRLAELDPELRERAAEDAVDSTLVAAAAADWDATGGEVLSYEGPFGVGYGVAVLFARPTGESVADDDSGAALARIARRSLETALAEPPADAPHEARAGSSAEQRGVFVTLRTRDGGLRGCVGTITAKFENVAAETWQMARAAAFRDTRFAPVRRDELPGLRIEVSVVLPPETVASAAELAPSRFGVIVSAADGRRGVLLPGIAGVETAAEQLAIARRKAGIRPGEPVALERFAVLKFTESEAPWGSCA